MFVYGLLAVLLASAGSSQAAECATASLSTASGSHAPTGKLCPGQLIFDEEFTTLDLQVWQHEITLGGGGNWEFEWYTNSRYNSFIDNGVLFIKPSLVSDEFGEAFLSSGALDINGGSPADACTNTQWYGCARTGTAANLLNPVKSARLRTVNSFSFKYGKLEVKAQLPTGDWLWPAIWLLPRYNYYSTWPTSGEIDLMESRGNKALKSKTGQNLGAQLVSQTLHWGPRWDINKYALTHWEKESAGGYDNAFHLYQMEWTPNYIKFSVDNVATGTVTPPAGGFWALGSLASTNLDNPWKRYTKMAPFDQEFYIILNNAVGGTAFFPDDATNPGGKPWRNNGGAASTEFWRGKNQWLPTWNLKTDQAALKIDYVKVWAL